MNWEALIKHRSCPKCGTPLHGRRKIKGEWILYCTKKGICGKFGISVTRLKEMRLEGLRDK